MKKVIALFLVALFAFAACGNNSKSNSSDNATAVADSTAKADSSVTPK
jgi:hypothetical protein